MWTVVVDHQVMVRELPEPDAKAEILLDQFHVVGPISTGWLCPPNLMHRRPSLASGRPIAGWKWLRKTLVKGQISNQQHHQSL